MWLMLNYESSLPGLTNNLAGESGGAIHENVDNTTYIL